MSGAMSALDGCAITPQVSGEEREDRAFWPTTTDPERINSQGEAVSTELIDPSFDFNVERDAESGDIVAVLAKTPDTAIQQGLSTGDSIYHRAVEGRDRTHEQVAWRRYFVDDITKTADNQLEATVIFHPEATSHEAAAEMVDNTSDTTGSDNRDTDTNDESGRVMSVSLPRVVEELIASRQFAEPPGAWYTTARKWTPDRTAVSRFEERYVPTGSEYEPVDSCDNLTFEKIEGEGTRQIVDDFLNGDHTPAVEHNLGDTGAGYLAAFGAYHTPDDADERKLMAVLTLDEHQNRAYFKEHNAVLISRLCCHPHCPKNTATWMIARSRDWAAEAGYGQMGSTAGVRYNRGTIYKAAGFDLNEEITGWAAGDGWTNRDGRSTVRDGARWYKRKYEYSL